MHWGKFSFTIVLVVVFTLADVYLSSIMPSLNWGIVATAILLSHLICGDHRR